MISVSDGWKTAHRQLLLPEAFIKISYFVTDPDVQDDLTSGSTDEMFYADTDSIVNELEKQVVKYTTLEDGLFMLDCNENYLPDVYGKTGYVSESWCNENCIFTVVPVIEITTTKVHENLIPGFTIRWSESHNEFPVRYRINVFKDNSLIVSKLVEGNKSTFNVVEVDYKDFNRITVEILEWCLPNKRARIEELAVGVERFFVKEDFMGYEHSQHCDILSGSLPKNEIIFRLNNSDDRWNPTKVTGIESYLLERQEVKAEYGMDVNGKVEWIQAGKFYMSEWRMPSNGLEATFTARSLLEFMNDLYTGIRNGTLYDVCLAALEQANLPLNRNGSTKWYLSETLKQYTTDFRPQEGDDPEEYTIAEILQMCANAGKCLMYQDHMGTIRIEPQFKVLQNYRIDGLVNYSYPELVTSKELKSVDVNDGLGTYTVNTKGESQSLKNEFILDTSHANDVAKWVGETLKYRNTISGDFRIDPRLEVTDLISVQGKYKVNYAVGVTDVKLSYNGSFKGSFEGRVFEFKPVEASYVGIPFSGEV